MKWHVMSIILVVILILSPHQVNRVMLVTCQLSLPAHTTKLLVSLIILTIFVVAKVISILFTWILHVLMNFICILTMIIQVNFSCPMFGVSRFSVIRISDTAKKSTSLIYGTVVQQCQLSVSDRVELWNASVAVNELAQFHGSCSFVENTYRVILGLCVNNPTILSLFTWYLGI